MLNPEARPDVGGDAIGGSQMDFPIGSRIFVDVHRSTCSSCALTALLLGGSWTTTLLLGPVKSFIQQCCRPLLTVCVHLLHWMCVVHWHNRRMHFFFPAEVGLLSDRCMPRSQSSVLSIPRYPDTGRMFRT